MTASFVIFEVLKPKYNSMIQKDHSYSLLDSVLSILQDNAASLNLSDIKWHLDQIGQNMAEKILLETLDKLNEDGYIKITNEKAKLMQGQPIIEHYIITLKGHIFHGYAKTALETSLDRIRLEKLDNLQREYASNLNKLTCVIAIGTTIAAIYYITQIVPWIIALVRLILYYRKH